MRNIYEYLQHLRFSIMALIFHCKALIYKVNLGITFLQIHSHRLRSIHCEQDDLQVFLNTSLNHVNIVRADNNQSK